jgi:hypothetical protein
VVLYECETWSLTLREEHRLRVFENRVLRRIFGPKRDEIIGSCRKLNNEDILYPKYNYNYKVNEDEIGTTFSTHGVEDNAYSLMARTSEGKRPPGTPKLTWENNIKMAFREIGWVVWTGFIWPAGA